MMAASLSAGDSRSGRLQPALAALPCVPPIFLLKETVRNNGRFAIEHARLHLVVVGAAENHDGLLEAPPGEGEARVLEHLLESALDEHLLRRPFHAMLTSDPAKDRQRAEAGEDPRVLHLAREMLAELPARDMGGTNSSQSGVVRVERVCRRRTGRGGGSRSRTGRGGHRGGCC